MVDSAAQNKNRKNKEPQIRPPAICVKMFGSVMNTSPGPASGSTPKAKQEGITISPAISATQVSRSTFLIQVAAEDGHTAHSDTQRKEGLTHSSKDHISDTVFGHTLKVRHQEKAQPFGRAGQCHGTDRQDNHNSQQTEHGDFHDLFHTFLQTNAADSKGKYDHQYRPEHQRRNGRKHSGVFFRDFRSCH